MGILDEFRQHWRPLAAGFLGIGSGLSLNSYLLSVFAPYMIEEFGWTRSQWAMMGLVQMLMLVCLPVAGRLTDLFGVRRVAMVGALSFPVSLVAITLMPGDIRTYLVIYIIQMVICSTTTSTVYSRVVATTFRMRRGLALGIAGSAPPVISALGAPAITAFVAGHGWRPGYLAVAAFCMVCGLLTMALLRREDDGARGGRSAAGTADYRTIFATPAFWIIFVALFLTNLPFALAVSQLKLLVLDQGLDDAAAAVMVSAFAIGSVLGRLGAGLALDAWPSHIVAAVAFFMPCMGLTLLALPFDAVWVVGVAVVLIGVSFGGEGDIMPYLETRYFDLSLFSSVSGLHTAAIGSAMGAGNLLLGIVLARTDSFHAYLVIAAVASAIGATMFLSLGLSRFRPRVVAV